MDKIGTGRAFRPDIEGLRAIAVLGVVAFHFGISGFQGGFAGVDVFFVISGYLITSHLHDELSTTGTINLWAFYARRARRLMPMCALVIAATLATMYVVYSPIEQREYLSYAAYSATYLVNIHLLNQALDYFGSQATANPFLHYWSLAVEEQFYLIWPAMLLLCKLLAQRHRHGLIVVGITVVSLVACLLVTHFNQPVSFYLLPFRIWEFSVGGLLAVAPMAIPAPPVLQRIVGILAILVSYFFMNEDMQFPGWLAVLPVAGTALVIRAGFQSASDALTRLLASRPMVTIGKLSYSIYLWHWPVVVFARVLDPRLGLWTTLACIVTTGVLSYLSYRLVELPFRQSTAIIATRTRTAGFMFAATTSSLLAVFVATQAARAGMSDQLAEIENTIKARPTGHKQNGQSCVASLTSSEVVTCTFGSKNASRIIALLGDSHAEMWSTSLIDVADKYNWRIVTFLKSSCAAADVPVWHGRHKRIFTECAEWRPKAIARIRDLKPDLVVVGQYSSSYMRPVEETYQKANASAWANGLQKTLTSLSGVVPRIVLVRDTPVLALDAPTCSSRAIWWKSSLRTCDISREIGLSEALAAIERREVERIANAAYLDLSDLICDRTTCRATLGQQLVYRDKHHISRSFAATIADPFALNLIANFPELHISDRLSVSQLLVR